MDNEKPSFWAILPAVVRYDKNITPLSRLLYAEISALCDKDGICKARNPYFARVFDISTRQISRMLGELEQAGHIRTVIDKVHGNKREITLSYTKTGEKVETRVETDMSIPIDRNVHRVETDMSIPIDRNVSSLMINTDLNNKEGNKREREKEKTAPAHVPPSKVSRGELKTFGEFQNVFLSDEEHQKIAEYLKASFPSLNGNSAQAVTLLIESMSAWQTNNKPYQNHFAALKRWIDRDKERGSQLGHVTLSNVSAGKKKLTYAEEMAILETL